MKFQRGLVLFLISISAQGFAAQSEYLHQTNLSARIMGMGGAYTAVADDFNSLYFNPAGLARLEGHEVNLDIQAGATPPVLGFYNSLSGAGNNPTQIQNVLQNNFGSHYSTRVGLGGTWVNAHWGFGIVPLDATVEMDIHGTSGISAGIQAYQDSTIQFGYGFNFNEDKSFSFGVSPKVVYRGYLEKDLSILDFVSSNQIFRPQDVEEGITIDTDIGALYTFKVPDEGWLSFFKYAKPTIGFAVRNAVDEGFRTNLHLYGPQTSANVDAKLGRRYDVGTRFDGPEFWLFKPKLMIDFHDIGDRYASFKKTSHFGAELLWKAFGWLNGSYALGLSEGYLTAGIGAQCWIFKLDLATYSEEIGTADSPKESRRYVVRLSADL